MILVGVICISCICARPALIITAAVPDRVARNGRACIAHSTGECRQALVPNCVLCSAIFMLPLTELPPNTRTSKMLYKHWRTLSKRASLLVLAVFTGGVCRT